VPTGRAREQPRVPGACAMSRVNSFSLYRDLLKVTHETKAQTSRVVEQLCTAKLGVFVVARHLLA